MFWKYAANLQEKTHAEVQFQKTVKAKAKVLAKVLLLLVNWLIGYSASYISKSSKTENSLLLGVEVAFQRCS